MSSRAQLLIQTSGPSLVAQLAVTDPKRQVDISEIVRHDRENLFHPEAADIGDCLFWQDSGVDRVIRVLTRVPEVISLHELLGQDGNHLDGAMQCITDKSDNEYATCTETTGGLYIVGKEFTTDTVLANIAEQLRVAEGLNVTRRIPLSI